MTRLPYDPASYARLTERVEYEAWLLEAVYALGERDLFPVWPDSVIYPVDRSKAQFIAHMRGNIVIGDWRPGFLKAGAPLVFVATFKLLDMLLEWVLEMNGVATTFRFQEKLRHLGSPQIFPPLLEARPWLKERIIGLYRTLEPLRGTIIHSRHFGATDGALRISSSRGTVPGPPFQMEAIDLRKLALTIVSVFRYLDGASPFDALREKTLRHDLDQLAVFHGAPLLGQKKPFHPCVRIYLPGSDPLDIDPDAIHTDLTQRYQDQDCLFDVRVLLVADGVVVDAYLFPWAVVASRDGAWRAHIDPSQFRVAIPQDIKPEHLSHPGS